MSAQNNGGSYHPVVHASLDNGSGACVSYQNETNWTVRDEFAARALAALIGHEGKDYENRGKKAVPVLAKFAYEYADAMLTARDAVQWEKGEQQ